MSQHHRPQRGLSLIEALIAVALLGIIGVAVISAVMTAVRSDGQHRSRSTAAVAARNYADALDAAPYADCASTAQYGPGVLGLDQTNSTITVDSVRYWNGSALPTVAEPSAAAWAAAFPPSCTTDRGLQRITYTARSAAGGSTSNVTRSVIKRFNGSLPEPVPDPPPGGRLCRLSTSTNTSSTWVNEFAGRQGTNYSTGSEANELNILYLAGSRRYSYLKFGVAANTVCDDGSTLPVNATILAAELRLYTFNIGGGPTCGAGSCWHVMERTRGAWTESTLTWNNQPCPTGYGQSCQPGDTASTILFEHGTGAFNWGARYQRIRSAQLLDDVRAFYASPTNNHGWVIKEACAQTYGKACGSVSPGFQMRSSRASQVEQRPTLFVYY